PSTGAIPHTHFAVGTCAAANDTRPGTDAFEYALAGSGQCAYAGFERVGWSEGLRFKRPGINQANVQPALLQRQCQRAADHPRAHDDEVRLHHSLLRVFNDLRKGQFQLCDGTTLSLYESARAALEGLTGASHPCGANSFASFQRRHITAADKSAPTKAEQRLLISRCTLNSEFSFPARPAPWPGGRTSPWPEAAGPAPADPGCALPLSASWAHRTGASNDRKNPRSGADQDAGGADIPEARPDPPVPRRYPAGSRPARRHRVATGCNPGPRSGGGYGRRCPAPPVHCAPARLLQPAPVGRDAARLPAESHPDDSQRPAVAHRETALRSGLPAVPHPRANDSRSVRSGYHAPAAVPSGRRR